MANIFQCFYIKSALSRINTGNPNVSKFDKFVSQFPHITLDSRRFLTYYKRYNDKFKKKTSAIRGAEKEQLEKRFNREKWDKLTDSQKLKHTLHECIPCKYFKLHPTASTPDKVPTPDNLPTPDTALTPDTVPTSDSLSTPAASTPLSLPVTPFQSLDLNVNLVIPISDSKISGVDKVAAKTVLDQIAVHWDKAYSRPFTKVLAQVPEANIQVKKTPYERKAKLRQMQRKVKASIESCAASNDCETFYGTRQSKSTYEKQRLSLCFESKANAAERTQKRKRFLYFSLT